GEKDGTLTNAEGRIQTVHYAVRTMSGARPDWRILSDLSGEMGVSLGYAAAPEITRDLLSDVPAYQSLADGAIPAEGAVVREFSPDEAWNGPAYAPLPVRIAGGAPRGAADGLTLLTYSELLGDETMLLETAELMEVVPEPYVELHHRDAERLGLAEGQLVELRTAKGSIQRLVRVNGRCPPGVCYTPDNSGRPRVNAILDWAEPYPVVQLVPVPQTAVVGAGD
ncbi:MAG TPA: molybdopterin dinucleotide binding domain-containing protein, partial [Chloroflexota bacterium]|nr:molybdopterin dinucleotide binding domain-containing protein [Chloroflexota bacterium]